MPEPTYLDLMDENGRPLRHKYFQQQGAPAGLALLLPGDNYGVDGPLLYYPGKLLWDLGWDTAAITYGYQSAGEPFSPLLIPDLLTECRRAVTALLVLRNYPRLVMLGKSLGALLIALLCQQEALHERVRTVYLTPPLGPMFTPLLLETHQTALLALGTEDRFFDADALQALEREKGLRLVVVEGADHSMNLKDELDASLEAVGRVTQAVIDFVTSENEG